MTRRILHVDLDAFFASVEELDHPGWRGFPLVVGADPQRGAGRGVVATANYAARAYGIRSAMPISEAWRRCPAARFVRPRMARYREKSREVFDVLREATDLVEAAGLDEAYLDVTAQTRGFAQATTLARRLQRRILEATRLSASFGVASGKAVAKIASDVQKPAGVTSVAPGTEAAFLAPLPVRRIPGIGPRSEARLAALGIRTCGDLAALPPARLVALFGAWGPRLHELARGVDDAPLEVAWERKSMGSEHTFPEDVADPQAWEASLEELAQDLAGGLAREGLVARTLTLKVRLAGFETYTRARTLPRPAGDVDTLARLARDLLRTHPPQRPVRLLGLRATHLAAITASSQADLARWSAAELGEEDPWRPPQRAIDDFQDESSSAADALAPGVRVVILAAGDSRRMGHPKALTPVDGRPALARMLEACEHAGLARPLVVLGRARDDVVAAIPDLPARARVVHNPDPDSGRTGSLKRALAVADGAVLVWPVDHPLVAPETLRLIAQTPGEVVLPVLEARGGHPLKLDGAALRDVRAFPDDRPLRDVLARHALRVVRVPVRDRGVRLNLDTPEDVARALRD